MRPAVPTTSCRTQRGSSGGGFRRAVLSMRGLMAVLAFAVVCLAAAAVAVRTGAPQLGGPLARHLGYQDSIPVSPGEVLTWGIVLPTNRTASEVVMLSVEPSASENLIIEDVALHDPDADGAVGGHHGLVTEGLHVTRPDGAVMAPAGGHLEALFEVRLADERTEGRIAGLLLRYRHMGTEFEDVVPLSLVVRPVGSAVRRDSGPDPRRSLALGDGLPLPKDGRVVLSRRVRSSGRCRSMRPSRRGSARTARYGPSAAGRHGRVRCRARWCRSR